MSRTLNSLIRVAAIVVALNATTAMAQSDWTGTWDSRYGELRLVQEGERVYGDYANRGYFEGRVSENGDRLRGTFQYNNPRSKNGYIEFVRSGASFTGGWNWARNGVASFETGNWTGTLKSSARPILRYAARRDDYWADFWPDTNVQVKGWAYEGSIIDEEQAAPALYGYSDIRGDEWQGTFTTNYGDLRLVQVGRRVFGDYAKRGYFEGCVHDGGRTMRGTFQYNSPRSKQGFVEFRADGDGFEGTWTWTRSGVPTSQSGINWRGARKAAPAPSLLYVTGEAPHFADNWPDLTSMQRRWVLGSDYYDSCDPPEVFEGDRD